jgi:hypothetical protein
MVHVEFPRYGYHSLQCCQRTSALSFFLPSCVLSCFLITITVPRVARDVFCPLRYSPACRSKTAYFRVSPLLVVHHPWFLTLHRRCICIIIITHINTGIKEAIFSFSLSKVREHKLESGVNWQEMFKPKRHLKKA